MGLAIPGLSFLDLHQIDCFVSVEFKEVAFIKTFARVKASLVKSPTSARLTIEPSKSEALGNCLVSFKVSEALLRLLSSCRREKKSGICLDQVLPCTYSFWP
jgi:hypothetical protein